MLQSHPLSHHGVIHFQSLRSARRPGLRRPLAMLAVLAAVLASGVVVGQLAPTHPQPAAQSQPFDHFPR